MKTTCLEISDIIETHKMQVTCDQGDHRLIMMLLMRPNTDALGSQHNASSWSPISGHSWGHYIIRIDLDNFGFSLFLCESTLNAHAIAINSLKIGQAFAFKY